MSSRRHLFETAVFVMRHLLGAVFAAVIGAVTFGLLLLVVHPWVPPISAQSGLAAFGMAVHYWSYGVAFMAVVGLIRPRWFLRESVMALDM